jgi:EAL domain-containing protein (putative c-di-GMP-specific phosphodiesterase class I)
MTVNISGRHMASARIIADVENALEVSGIPPHRLVIEIAEKDLIDDAVVMANLRDLRSLGVTISVDSFGTGYNLITKLAQLPIDLIKIDPSLLTSPHPISRELFRLIVRAAHEFGLPVVADGVEHVDHLSTLRFTECDFAQGFFFAEPMPAQDVQESLIYQAMAGSR